MIRIVSLDDHPLFGCGLRESLHAQSKDFQVTTIATPNQALAYLSEHTDIDLLLLDVTMPNMNGVGFMRALTARGLVVPVAILSAQEDLTVFQSLLDLGAMGIISKAEPSEEIAMKIREIMSGQIVVPKRIKVALSRITKFAEENTQSVLSKRQFEILQMVQAGLSNQGIGDILYISERTVKSHLQSIFKIIGASNRVDCVRKAENLAILTKSSSG